MSEILIQASGVTCLPPALLILICCQKYATLTLKNSQIFKYVGVQAAHSSVGGLNTWEATDRLP